MSKREMALAAIETVIAVGVGLVLCGQAVGGAWKCLRRRRSALERHPD